jgi:hypothetical protein
MGFNSAFKGLIEVRLEKMEDSAGYEYGTESTKSELDRKRQ